MLKHYFYGVIFWGLGSLSVVAAIFQTDGHSPGESWETATKWSDGLVPSAGNAYVNDTGGDTRTPSGGGTFAGDSLTLSNGSSLKLKNGTSALSVDLVMEGGTRIVNGGGGTALVGGTLSGSGSVEISNDGFSERTVQLEAQLAAENTISTLVISSGTVQVNAAGNTFSGTWDVQGGRLQGIGFGSGSFNVAAGAVLDFDADFTNETGSLNCDGVLQLDQQLTFDTGAIAGVDLPAGSYSADELIHTLGVDAAVLEDGLASTGTLTLLTTADSYRSELTFSADGEPATLILDGNDRLQSHSSDGFYLRYFDGQSSSETKMEHITTVGDTITVSESGGLPRFTLRIVPQDRYIAIHLVDIEGIPEEEIRAYGFYLKLYSNTSFGFKDLDDVINSSGSDPVYFRWPYLWGQNYQGQRGGVAFYDGSLTGAELDSVLSSIWLHEDLPRPAGQDWTSEADVMAWVDRYQAEIGEMNEVILEASSEAELYALTDAIVFPNHVKRVYLHTKTWRGEYWPKYYGLTHVNTDVFPAGAADLKAYADYLAAQGVKLHLHNVSCGIGKYDPTYIVGTVDRRLASWGSGTLEKAVDASETRLLFRPDAGTKPPVLGNWVGHAHVISYYNYFRIGEEIVRPERISRTDEEVWVLEDCSRGHEGTDAFAHVAGEETEGIFCPYNSNYIPEYDLGQTNSLMETLAMQYADWVDYLQLGHLHFDGPEIHRTLPWIERDLFNLIYSEVDHPTSSSRVGKPIAAHFEQAFSGLRDDLSLSYFAMNVDIRTDELHTDYLATSRLDTHFHVQESIMVHGFRPFFTVPMSGRGISEEVMNNHGLFDEMSRLFGDWIKLAPVFHDDDVAYVSSVMSKSGNHYQGEDVLVLSTNVMGQYIWTPHHVMGRSDGSDAPFSIEQEKGVHARKQIITSGTALSLTNPYGAQALNFVLRVDHEGTASLTNPTITVGSSGTLTVTGTVAPGEYLEYYGGDTAQLYDHNWNLLSDLPVTATSFTVASGTNTISVSDGGAATIETQYIVLGDEYVLKTNDNL